MELKELLGEELYASVAAKLGDKKLVIDDGKLIPDYRLKEVTDEKKALKEQVSKYEADMKELKAAAAGNDALAKQIADLQTARQADKERFEAGIMKSKKQLAIQESLLSSGVIDASARELLSLKFDVDKIELDDSGKPKGFDTLLKPIKENRAFSAMFGEVKMSGQKHEDGPSVDTTLGEWGTKNPWSQKTVNYTAQIELSRTQPELAKRLQASAQT